MEDERRVPDEIETAFYPGGLERVQRLGDGLINITLVAEANGKKQVLQRLGGDLEAEMIEDYEVVAEHLQADGWEIPALVRTPEGFLYETDDNGKVWRVFEYLESDADTGVEVTADYADYGALLGKLHRSLASLDYEPTFTIPHFHETAHFARELRDNFYELPLAAQWLADDLLDKYAALAPLPNTADQLIHGDPKVANMLYRDGKPFTFIDWDTLMVGSVWFDIGDLLRSVAGQTFKAEGQVSETALKEVIKGYWLAAQPDEDLPSFERNALLAAQVIAIELAMRYVADYKDGEEGLFVYDPAVYDSRHEYTMEKAELQLAVFNDLQHLYDQGAQ